MGGGTEGNNNDYAANVFWVKIIGVVCWGDVIVIRSHVRPLPQLYWLV